MAIPNSERAWAVQVVERVQTLMDRQRPRWTMAKLSLKSGVPYPSVYGYMIGKKQMPAFVLVKIAAALGVSVDLLAGVA